MIGKFLKTWMAGQSAVTALIGTGDNLRFWPQEIPQHASAFPRILYTIDRDVPLPTLGGPSKTRIATVTLDLQEEDGDYSGLQTLAEAIVGKPSAPKLDGFRGKMAGIWVQCCRVEDKPEEIDPPFDAGDEGIRHSLLEATITYNIE